LQSAALADLHAAHAAGSPPPAVAWQSAEADAGVAQLTLQKLARSSQLVSGGAAVAPASTSGGGVVGAPRVSLHGPRCSIALCSPHAVVTPPTHAVSPHARVRLCPLLSTAQVQSSFDEVHDARAAPAAMHAASTSGTRDRRKPIRTKLTRDVSSRDLHQYVHGARASSPSDCLCRSEEMKRHVEGS
jgi:hypothetical protein